MVNIKEGCGMINSVFSKKILVFTGLYGITGRKRDKVTTLYMRVKVPTGNCT